MAGSRWHGRRASPSAPFHGPVGGRDSGWACVLATAFVAVLVAVLVPPLHLDTSPFIHSVRAAATPVSEVARPVASLGSSLSLGVSATPDTIRAAGLDNCPAGTGISRVTLSADAETAPTPYWPNVQVAFVIETTAYDGFYYHYYGYPGKDKCALAGGGQDPPCEESNGGPFFIANAQQIANEISTANPHSKVSFAMVDFFGTDCGDWDDCGDSSKYDVDIPQFIPAASFGGAVQQSVLGWDVRRGIHQHRRARRQLPPQPVDHRALRDDHWERPRLVAEHPPRDRPDRLDRPARPVVPGELRRKSVRHVLLRLATGRVDLRTRVHVLRRRHAEL